MQPDPAAGGVPGRPRTGHADPAEDVEVMQVVLPRQDSPQARSHRGGRAGAAEGPDHGDAEGTGIEPTRVRPDDGAAHPAVAALVDRAEPVDEEVVADVAPAVGLDVVAVDG